MASEVFSDQKWQAECDARTLADADEIKKDTPRLDKAKTAAQKLAEKKQVELASMKKVASIGGSQKAPATSSKKYFNPGGGIRINKA